MNNEIKEILDDLLFTTTLPNVSVKLNKEKLNQLKDYITNLQHIEDLYNQLLKDYDKLQQVNERLKDQNIKEILKKDLEICAKQYKKSDEKLEKYKSRIDKAVEYIETNEGYSQLSGIWEFYGDTDDLLNILRGKNK